MKEFYHASVSGSLKQLDVISKCNEKPCEKCAYVTDNYYYALFYIRDMDINIVTACVNDDGLPCYEEQFKNQLKVMYKNKAGFVYYCLDNNKFIKSETNGIYYSNQEIKFGRIEKISNVYALLKKAIKENKIKLVKNKDVAKDRLDGLYNHIAKKIVDKNFYENNVKLQKFYKKHYKTAWKLAKNLIENKF